MRQICRERLADTSSPPEGHPAVSTGRGQCVAMRSLRSEPASDDEARRWLLEHDTYFVRAVWLSASEEHPRWQKGWGRLPMRSEEDLC